MSVAEHSLRAVAIGGSAGGIEALRLILPSLPADFPLPVFVALHIHAGAREDRWALVFADAKVAVREPEDKERASPGIVYIAPADYHLLVDEAGIAYLSADARVHASRPSIDVLFESAAWAYGSGLLAIVLSGANSDGAAGLREVREAGGTCWVQSPDDSVAVMMPQAALRAVPSAAVLTAREIADRLASLRGIA